MEMSMSNVHVFVMLRHHSIKVTRDLWTFMDLSNAFDCLPHQLVVVYQGIKLMDLYCEGQNSCTFFLEFFRDPTGEAVNPCCI